MARDEKKTEDAASARKPTEVKDLPRDDLRDDVRDARAGDVKGGAVGPCFRPQRSS